MKLFILTLCLLLGLAASAHAVEDLTLTTPITGASTAKWRVKSFYLDRTQPIVTVVFEEPTLGTTATCSETGSAATTLISNLNTANLTSNSLQKRSITWAQGKGCLTAGSIAGTPD